MFHIVYNSYESKPNGRDYIGKHSTDDLNDGYLGSFKDTTFNPDSKIAIAYANTAEGAIWLEMMFQRVFGVVEDPQFANRAYQTSMSFTFSARGENNPSKKPEVREKISKSNKGRKRPDLVERNLNDNPAKKPEVREKMSQSATGRQLSQTAKDKVSEFQSGRPKSEETKRKMREARARQAPPTLGKT